MTVYFDVPGDPVPKGRPRFARVGAGMKAYTPAKTATYEQMVALHARAAMRSKPVLEGPLQATLTFGLPIPRSWPAKRRQAAALGELWPTAGMDIDNAAKSLLDGCNGIVYKDDAQVVRLLVVKMYAIEPGCSVRIEPIAP